MQGYWGATKPTAGVRLHRGHPLTQGLAGYWLLGDSPNLAMDVAGSAHLTGTNSPTLSVGTHGGRAARFVAASSQSYSVADTARLSGAGLQGLTVSCWVNLTSLVNATMVAKWGTASLTREYILFYNLNDHAPNQRFSFGASNNGESSGAVFVDATTFGAPAVDQWYCVTGWYDPSSGTINIQVNGGAVNSQAFSSGIYDSTSSFVLGRLATVYFLDARMQNVGVWKRVLSESERDSLFSQPYAMFQAPVWRRYFVVPAAPASGTIPPIMHNYRRRRAA